MVYNPNIPQPTDLLSDSQGDILNNFTALDTVYGGDHYPFSDVTANSTKHKTVTTPIQNPAVHPTPATNELKFYAMQDTAPLGVLQYSRRTDNGGVAQPPSPVTRIYTSVAATTIAAAASNNLLDLTGLTFCTGNVYVSNIFSLGVLTGTQSSVYNFIYDTTGTNVVLKIYPTTGTLLLPVSFSGNILRVTNNSGLSINYFCTIELLRVNV